MYGNRDIDKTGIDKYLELHYRKNYLLSNKKD